MRPYYDESGISIYHGDCREVLPSLGRFDLLLTDPPYGICLNTDNSRFSGGVSPHKRSRPSAGKRPIVGDDNDFDPDFLLGVAKHSIIWGWNNFAGKLPRGACLVWLKRNDEAFQSFLSDAEVAWLSKGHGVYCHRDLSNNRIANTRVHPTQKPVGLMKWCIERVSGTRNVLDPYLGSGSSLIAARMMGLRGVGIEIDERYCEAAAKRLSQKLLEFASA